jgi:hypothetical protein
LFCFSTVLGFELMLARKVALPLKPLCQARYGSFRIRHVSEKDKYMTL